MAKEMVRVPNSDVWVNPAHIAAVARLSDTEQPVQVRPGEPVPPKIFLLNFQIRSVDGKSTNVQVSDRMIMKEFLYEIGIVWEG